MDSSWLWPSAATRKSLPTMANMIEGPTVDDARLCYPLLPSLDRVRKEPSDPRAPRTIINCRREQA